MQVILHLSKEDLTLSEYEAVQLLKPQKKQRFDAILILDIEPVALKYVQRLAYSHAAYELLLRTTEKKLVLTLEQISLKKQYHPSFRVRKEAELSLSEQALGKLVWNKLISEGVKPHVNLKSPRTVFTFLGDSTHLFLGKQLWKNDHSYLDRRAHLRPVLCPVSLHPKIARAMINLSGVQNGTILDPFCGTGGILIEAGLMGLSVKGCDINSWMIKASQQNLAQYGAKPKVLTLADACTLQEKADAIVTDLPYAKNTRTKDLEPLFTRFFAHAQTLTDTIVVGLPDFAKYRSFISGWKVKNRFTYYLHKSLSKTILVLEKES